MNTQLSQIALHLLADVDSEFQSEKNGPGFFFCPVCNQAAIARWNNGHAIPQDIPHSEHCPVIEARKILGRN